MASKRKRKHNKHPAPLPREPMPPVNAGSMPEDIGGGAPMGGGGMMPAGPPAPQPAPAPAPGGFGLSKLPGG